MHDIERFHEVSVSSIIETTKLNFSPTYRGGFLPKRLYEVYGESGTGKTQFAIQLLLNVSETEHL